MSTAARKTRKREAQQVRASGFEPERGMYRHAVKVGTPVADRIENQSRPYRISATISGNRPTAKARRRLAEAEARSVAAAKGTPWPDYRRASRA